MCVVAGWERGAKTVLETGEKVKIPWGQQGPGGNKISGKILRMNEDFLKILGGCEDRSKMGIGGFSFGNFLDIFHEKRFSRRSDVSRFTLPCSNTGFSPGPNLKAETFDPGNVFMEVAPWCLSGRGFVAEANGRDFVAEDSYYVYCLVVLTVS